MRIRDCEKQGCKDKNNNCYILGHDNLPVQCIGSWAEDKYFFLERYLDASREARRKFENNGNAVFIDLFAGPGKCVIRKENREIDSGGMRALNIKRVPFNHYIYFDINEANIEALKKRAVGNHNCSVECGDSNILVAQLVANLQKSRYDKYHFAFIDPFGPDGLKFTTLGELAKLKRMDMLIHFPIGAIQRNWQTWLQKENAILDDFLGTNIWRESLVGISGKRIVKELVGFFKDQLKSIGYPEDGLRMASSDSGIDAELPTVPIKNTKERELYVLILAAKNPLAQKIWNSVITISPDGQRNISF